MKSISGSEFKDIFRRRGQDQKKFAGLEELVLPKGMGAKFFFSFFFSFLTRRSLEFGFSSFGCSGRTYLYVDHKKYEHGEDSGRLEKRENGIPQDVGMEASRRWERER